jgi:diaminohydroxyphosphoribosylaminopyrimidine deaminase/5-amino-6-(5-phosphoribosylamino)uracil reductase
MISNKYIRLAVEIAKRGEGKVEPNPLVGAVIVKDGKIIGKGYHQYFGGPHAEINAINSVRNHADLKGATLYINLEPCAHFGKTPPCAPAVIQSGIKKVVIAKQDPNPLVSGKGIQMLRDAGITVELLKGTIAKEAEQMNATFFKLQKTGLPYVIAKWAMTADGKLATVTGDSKWISSEQSRELVQEIRSKVSGILVGINTVLKDNPMLIPHPVRDRSSRMTAISNGARPLPSRIIIDSFARIPLNSQIVKTANHITTYIAVSKSAPAKKLQVLTEKGCIIIKTKSKNTVDLKDLFRQLAAFGINKILVEGGGEILGSIFAGNLADEVYIFIAPKITGGRDAKTPVEGPGIKLMRNAINLRDMTVKQIGPDVLLHGKVDK